MRCFLVQNNQLHTPDSITQFTQKMDIFGFSIKVTICQLPKPEIVVAIQQLQMSVNILSMSGVT